ncbi:putative cytochrome P450 [Dactylonectria macrodidyma]|uniref:Cytochrome P450 n=1 Tax=Dactylonectria macrodidyma TaxID=307937 RepID=A0A9P9IG49_9HYPO|nr:putative cytochrome P450 [Dactylonectria macrodidyma]
MITVSLRNAPQVSLTATFQIINNLYFHPLARFPGPFLYRATRITFVYKLLRGSLPFDVLHLHEKYGPVVRIAPNELSFVDPEAWKDIYGHRTGPRHHGQDELPKYDIFYRPKNVPPNVSTEDRDNHSMLRRQLSHGFSDRCMREQEPIIGSYVDLLVRRLRERCVELVEKGMQTTPKPMDMTAWYNWTTFDIIGDLAFGEPFGSLENAGYHPWVAAVNATMLQFGTGLAMRYLGLGGWIEPLVRSRRKNRKAHMDYTRDKLTRRMQLNVERPDLIEGLLKKKDDWVSDLDRIQINANVLIIAGSETTATLLAGATYLLLKNPEAMKKLTAEVRSTFRSDDEMTLTSVGKLGYMKACLDEALRRYPPVPMGQPRVVFKGGTTIAGEFVPEKTVVSVWQWAANHHAHMWKDPLGYRPERFLQDPQFADDKLDALQPFAVGPRNCIGRNLANSEMRLILARLILNFDMRLVDENVDWMDQNIYMFWEKKPLNVYLTPVRE